MTPRKILALGLAAAALLAAPLLTPSPAHAANQVLCSPDVAGGVQGPRRVVNTSSTATTQPAYQLNGQGCALFAQADIGFFLSQGFTAGSDDNRVIYTTGVLTSTTSVQIATLPPGAYIKHIFIDNTTANAVTGGIDIGKTASATDIVSAKTCAANCLSFVADSALLLRNFSKTAAQAVFATGHTDWNSANVTFTIVYGYF